MAVTMAITIFWNMTHEVWLRVTDIAEEPPASFLGVKVFVPLK
jgi:hypothetical protein